MANWVDRLVLLIVALAPCAFVLRNFLKVRFSLSASLVVLAVVHKELDSDVGSARQVGARAWPA